MHQKTSRQRRESGRARATPVIEATGPRTRRPVAVTRAALLWSIAVAAGVVETALAVTESAKAGTLGMGIWLSVAVRALIYVGAAMLVANFVRGRRWARWCLVGLLSVIGLGTMVVPPVMMIAAGTPFLQAITTTGDLSIPFLVVRVVHIVAVVAATALMFTPNANRYFDASRARLR